MLKNIHEVRSFLGLCSYYRRFIKWFANIASPLHALTKKGVHFKWIEKERNTFGTSKEKLTTTPVLTLPDFRKPFLVQCDACGSSIGAVLTQDGHPIAYESRILKDSEKPLQIYEKELLAVIHALAT